MDNIQMECFNKIKHCLIGLFLLVCFSFSSTVSALDKSQLASATADGMYFRVSYKSKVEPLPLNHIHSWILHVETLDGKPVGNAEISVHGGMPAHKHGLPTEPVVTRIGEGDYLVEGLKFSMTGKWQVWFNIRNNEIIDKIKFEIEF